MILHQQVPVDKNKIEGKSGGCVEIFRSSKQFGEGLSSPWFCWGTSKSLPWIWKLEQAKLGMSIDALRGMTQMKISSGDSRTRGMSETTKMTNEKDAWKQKLDVDTFVRLIKRCVRFCCVPVCCSVLCLSSFAYVQWMWVMLRHHYDVESCLSFSSATSDPQWIFRDENIQSESKSSMSFYSWQNS